MRIGQGELIEPGAFLPESSGEFFKVLHQVHGFEKLDDGEILQKVTIFTSKVYDCATVRSEWLRSRG